MSQQSFLCRLSGPYLVFIHFILLALAGLMLSRLALMLWQWERVQAAGDPVWMLVQGVRADLILLGLLVAIPLLLAPVLALARFQQLWRRFSYIWCLIALTLLIFIELSTPSFLLQYDVRPNRLYIRISEVPERSVQYLMAWFSGATDFGHGIDRFTGVFRHAAFTRGVRSARLYLK
jgi:hypothetical protein